MRTVMRSKKSTATFLIKCKDRDNCKTVLDSLGKRYRRNIRAMHRTRPFTDPDKVKSKLLSPNTVRLGGADYIVEIVTNRHNELEHIEKDFRSQLPPLIASMTIA